ncbi:hypothetical protein Tco_0045160 [Tanacetum coccineum]
MHHRKLNLDNVFVKDNYTAKLASLAHIELLSHEERTCNITEYLSVDVFEIGKILLLITIGKHGGDATWEDDSLDLERF